MGKRASVKDIAEELHISLSTVHKALTGKKGISEARREEVLAVAKKLGYEVNSVAQSLARHDLKLGIVMPTASKGVFAVMKEGMMGELERLQKHKVRACFYTMETALTQENAVALFSWIEENKIEALIYCPSITTHYHDFLPILKDVKIPLFFAGDEYKIADSVTDIAVDNHMSGKLAADFLRCIEGENLRAVVFYGSYEHKEHREKINIFTRRAEQAGGKIVQRYETDDDFQKTYAYMEELSNIDANAIYVSTTYCLPVCQYIEEHDLAGQYSVVCTDVTDEMKEYMRKGIVKATISQRQEEVGKVAVRTAYEYLVKKNSYGNEDIQVEPIIWIQPKLLLLADVE